MLSGKGDTDATIENIHIRIPWLPNKCRRFALKIMIQHSEILHEKAIFLSVVLILAADLRELYFWPIPHLLLLLYGPRTFPASETCVLILEISLRDYTNSVFTGESRPLPRSSLKRSRLWSQVRLVGIKPPFLTWNRIMNHVLRALSRSNPHPVLKREFDSAMYRQLWEHLWPECN